MAVPGIFASVLSRRMLGLVGEETSYQGRYWPMGLEEVVVGLSQLSL